MKIGIFSKFEMAGGSEFRCVELANGLVNYSDHEVYFLVENNRVSDKIIAKLESKVHINMDSMKNPGIFYEMDHILVVNTDSKYFTTIDYWEGKSEKHDTFIDLTKIKSMSFLFNFIVSPARHLEHIQQKCKDIRLIPTNKRFYKEIDTKDKHEKIRHFPRMVLESPINPDTVSTYKSPTNVIRIGKHSKGLGSKWNMEHKDLILAINEKYGEDKIQWDFMGGGRDFTESVKDIPNVILRKEFSIPVKVYLYGIDIFLFYPDWGRQEPWSRAVAEGIMSGCPILATDVDGGNRMQVKENGYLCKDLNIFIEKLSYLIDNTNVYENMRNQSIEDSKLFTSEKIVERFLDFIA